MSRLESFIVELNSLCQKYSASIAGDGPLLIHVDYEYPSDFQVFIPKDKCEEMQWGGKGENFAFFNN